MFETETRIFVVALILAIIVAGIALFLFYLEWRLRKSEERMKLLERELEERKAEIL